MGSKLTKDQMTPRQLEAWVLTFASQDFDVEAAARDMGIKPSSVSKVRALGSFCLVYL